MVSEQRRGKRYLITGISGFVAGHYLEYLARHVPDARVIGVDINPPELSFLGSSFKNNIEFHQNSLLDQASIKDIIAGSPPDYIVHLASFSSVAFSWKEPVPCFVNNTNIFLNVIDAVRKAGITPRILSVGSSEEYGAVDKKNIPLKEDAPLNPASPYAVARVSQEMVSRIYSRGYGLPIICTRSFNHIGPRQREIFAVSSFAKQAAEAKKGIRNHILCGDIDIIRDFIDVRDAVRAYDILLQRGTAGEVYNVCSGQGHSLSEIIEMLKNIAGLDMTVLKDPSLIRPVDNPMIIGSCDKLKKEVSFSMSYDIKDSLADVLAYWEDHV